MLSEQQRAAVNRRLSEEPAIAAAFLLGSAAEKRLRPDSDVDIAILPSDAAAMPLQKRLALSAALSGIVGREVDLGVLSTGNLVYAKEAVTRGVLMFERDHGVTARFAMYTLSMYASLQEARREVLRAYAA
ncbi:MAG: nucleotidyltransferase domain-containing protein [Planctomycetia bacterium]|nr:nucleotidyltransferase domain-containing protein [Planctomycetia bacterium]